MANIKRNSIIIASLAVLAILVSQFVMAKTSFTPYNPHLSIPEKFMMNDMQGNPVSFNTLKGTPYIINFWAPWCGPCVREMPSLNKLQDKYGADNLRVIPIAVQSNKTNVVDFFRRKGLTLEPFMDDEAGTLRKGFGVKTLPITFLVNKKGHVIGSATGPRNWLNPAILADVEKEINR